MKWKVGQKLVCDRPEQLLTGCTVALQENGWVVISCPTAGLTLSGYQEQFERSGWKAVQQYL
jgi:hypothetical protein